MLHRISLLPAGELAPQHYYGDIPPDINLYLIMFVHCADRTASFPVCERSEVTKKGFVWRLYQWATLRGRNVIGKQLQKPWYPRQIVDDPEGITSRDKHTWNVIGLSIT